MLVNKFGVQNLETLRVSADLLFRVWTRCRCQQIWRSESGNVVRVSGFGVQCQRISCSEFGNVAFPSEFGVARNAVPVNGFGVQCLETLCLSADLVFRIWKRCAWQQIWHSESGNVVPVSGFSVQNLETLCLSRDLIFNVSKRYACQPI